MILNAVYLFVIFDLHVEMAGSGMIPIIRFESEDKHYSRLEEHRSQSNSNTPILSDADSSKPYWTKYRGPDMDGHYDQTEILIDWPDSGLPLLWKQPIGGGYASFVIAHGLAFTIEQRRDRETVVAYELRTGAEVWVYSWEAEFKESMGGDGPRATPTWDEGRIYALGATGELKVLEALTGDLLWEKNILEDNGAGNLKWGMAASPLIVDEKVIVQPGGSDERSIVAYDKVSGEPIWSSLNDPQAYTSPMLLRFAEFRQIVTATAERVVGINPENGALLWSYPWVTSYGVNAAQPIILDDNRFFISAGYDHGAAVVEVTRKEDDYSVNEIWENNRMKNRFNSSVLFEGFIYGFDEAIFACIDPQDGRRLWKGGRYGHGQVLLASGHLIILTEKGELTLVQATPDSHRELSRFQALRGKTWNNPAIADGILLVRNAYEMAAFRISP